MGSRIILNRYKLCGGPKTRANGRANRKLKSSKVPTRFDKSLICIVKGRPNPIMRLLKLPAPGGRSGCGRKIPWNIPMKLLLNRIPSPTMVPSVEEIRCGGNKKIKQELFLILRKTRWQQNVWTWTQTYR